MKTVYALLLAMLSTWAHAQSPIGLLMGSVTDSLGSPVANQLVTLNAIPTPGTAGSPITSVYTTSASGYYGDSIVLPGISGTVSVSMLDCNGTTISQSFSYSPSSGSVLTMNAPFVWCASGSTGGTALSCTASFYPDSNQVAAGLVYLVNASTTSYSGPATTSSTAYAWDFGDGGTATGAYPSHFYTAPGSYSVCVTLASSTANGYSCSDTYCDSITIDSTGFMVFKTHAGFSLQVIDASQLRTAEFPALQLHLNPNPASSGTPITWSSNVAVDEAELLDLQGRVLRTGNSSLATEGLPAGIYVVRAGTPWGPISQRIVLTQ
jgi:hypothetical protein